MSSDSEPYDQLVILVDVKGELRHPEDGEGQWFKAYLVYGPGDKRHIEAVAGSPQEAVDFALDIWARKPPRNLFGHGKEVSHGTQAGGTQPPAGSEIRESVDVDHLRRSGVLE